MSYLPDELWSRILQIGIVTCCLTYKDLCCVSILSHRFRRLSSKNSLWNYLVAFDFYPPLPPLPPLPPYSLFSSFSSRYSSKSLYKSRFEKLKEIRRRKLSDKNRHYKRLLDIYKLLGEEIMKSKQTTSELYGLRSRVSAWQPQVVGDGQKPKEEQCAVYLDIHFLEMKLFFCKRQIELLQTYQIDEKRKLNAVREELLSMKFPPMYEHRHKRLRSG